MVLGWNFVKSIFGQKERLCLMGVFIVQSILWAFPYFMENNPYFESSTLIESSITIEIITLIFFLSFVVMIIYLFIRKAETRSHKAVENLKKYQLFRFVYIMIIICFYLVGALVGIMVGILMRIIKFH